MPRAARHVFETSDPIQRFTEQVKFYGTVCGVDADPAMAIPRTRLADCRQVAEGWDGAFRVNLHTMTQRSASWKPVAKKYLAARKRLAASKLGPHDVYDDNPGFWKAIYQVASEIASLEYGFKATEVLVWAVKDTVEEHAETVYNAGRDALDAATGAVRAIPTIAKALAAGALGLGVYAIATRRR